MPIQTTDVTRTVTVIANCHTGPLAQILAFCGRGIKLDGIFVDNWDNLASEDRKKADVLQDTLGDDSLVFSFVLSAAFGQLETAGLRKLLGDRLVTFTNVRFDGLHPDMTYFGPFGGRWSGLLADYHSRIVMHSFSAGRSASECAQMFRGEVYEDLGYFEVFDTSATELKRRDLACDVRCADNFLELIQQEYCLLTFNHPTSIVFSSIVKALCQYAHIEYVAFEERLYPNPLVQSVIWPIYNEVAESLRLPYRSPQFFSQPPTGYVQGSSRSLSIPEFVHGCYDFYSKYFEPAQFAAVCREVDPTGKYQAVLG